MQSAGVLPCFVVEALSCVIGATGPDKYVNIIKPVKHADRVGF